MSNSNIVIVIFFIILFILILAVIHNYILNSIILKTNKKIIEPFLTGNYDRKPHGSYFGPKTIETDRNITDSIVYSYNLFNSSQHKTNLRDFKYYIISSYNYFDKSDNIFDTLNENNVKSINLVNDTTSTTSYFNINDAMSTEVRNGNYICIIFPYDSSSSILGLNAVKITSDQNIPYYFKLFGNISNSKKYDLIHTVNTLDNDTVILEVDKNAYNDLGFILNNRILMIHINSGSKQFLLRKMEFFFNEIASTKNTDGSIQTINTHTNVLYPKVELPDITKFNSSYDNSMVAALQNIIVTDTPSYIFDFGNLDDTTCYELNSDGNVTKIKEYFDRKNDDIKLTGDLPKIEVLKGSDGVPYSKYLVGTTNTNIKFPTGTLPRAYTICALTKYLPGPKQRILQSDKYNYLIGHWGGSQGIIYNELNGGFIQTASEYGVPDKWVLTCIKTSGNGIKNIIVNGVNVPGDGGNSSNMNTPITALGINKGGWTAAAREVSNFAIKTLLVWNKPLSDSSLQAISDAMMYMMTTGTYNIKYNPVFIDELILDPEFPKNGRALKQAANSALEILQKDCNAKNGLYWINIPNVGPRQIYCIMDTTCHGGGWMLALQGRNGGNTFRYDSHHWTTPSTLNVTDASFITASGNPDLNKTVDAKYDVYNFKAITDCMALFPALDLEVSPTFSSSPQYGWVWLYNSAVLPDMSLLDFFKGNNANYSFYCGDTNMRKNNARPQRSFDGTLTAIRKNLVDQQGALIFPQYGNNGFASWGLNYTNDNNWAWNRSNDWSMNARWGASFNNEYDDGSNDMTSGIGLGRITCGSTGYWYDYNLNSKIFRRANSWSPPNNSQHQYTGFQWYVR